MKTANPSTKERGLRARAPSEGSRLVGVDAAANMLGISPGYLYRMLRAGDLPIVKLGGRTLLAVSEIDKFVAAQSRAFLNKPTPKAQRAALAGALAAGEG